MQGPHQHPEPQGKDIDRTSAHDLTFYPAYTFKASATWCKWVKLTANDIHSVLEPHSKYANVSVPLTLGPDHGREDPPLLLFYLNHPIQFVQVIGVIVACEDYFEKFWLFTIDDSSGATIDATCRKPEKERELAAAGFAEAGGRSAPRHASNAKPSTHQPAASNSEVKGDDEDDPSEEQALHRTLSKVQIGTVVQAKGTLRTFRSVRQLALLRLSIVPDTTHEMALLADRTAFHATTLTRPWLLSAAEVEKLHAEAQGEKEEGNQRAQRRRKREAKRREREDRHAKQIRQEWEREETKRKHGAEEARRAGDMLQAKRGKGSS